MKPANHNPHPFPDPPTSGARGRVEGKILMILLRAPPRLPYLPRPRFPYLRFCPPLVHLGGRGVDLCCITKTKNSLFKEFVCGGGGGSGICKICGSIDIDCEDIDVDCNNGSDVDCTGSDCSVIDVDCTGIIDVDCTGIIDVDCTGIPHVDCTGIINVDCTGILDVDYTGIIDVDCTGIIDVDCTGIIDVDCTGIPHVDCTGIT
ncbi:zinc finger protein 281 [Lasius niger]|uniref:Zinc finger protein 281 n=1 Tax=Lasius niger TaxID=67767 RepID=A0A0J7MXA2_LASNI|nr:zinc finger protein 281 [Lasius niger]